MAKFHGLVKGDLKGNAGQFSFRQVKGMTVASGRIYQNASAGDGATLAQREHRCKLANVVNFYRAIIEFEKRAWEGKPERVSDYNMFVKNNIVNNNIYLPKNYATAGACVPGRYVVANGHLKPVEISNLFGAGINTIKTGLALGEMPVGVEHTLGDIATAIVDNNQGYQAGDKITFGFIRRFNETFGNVTFPFISVEYIELQLDTANESLASDILKSANVSYSITDNALSFDGSVDGVFAVHTRMVGGMLQASNQLVVLPATQSANPYGTEAWIEACCDSYGYKGDVLIQPSDVASASAIRVQVTPVAGENGTVSGGGQAVAGRSVTVRATPNENYTFKGWYDNAAGAGQPLSTSATYTFTAPEQDITIYAIFATPVQLTFGRPTNASISVNGNVLSFTGESEVVNVPEGQPVIIQATPANNYVFTKWTKNGTDASTSNPWTVSDPTTINNGAIEVVVTYSAGPSE